MTLNRPMVRWPQPEEVRNVCTFQRSFLALKFISVTWHAANGLFLCLYLSLFLLPFGSQVISTRGIRFIRWDAAGSPCTDRLKPTEVDPKAQLFCICHHSCQFSKQFAIYMNARRCECVKGRVWWANLAKVHVLPVVIFVSLYVFPNQRIALIRKKWGIKMPIELHNVWSSSHSNAVC